MKIKLEQEYAMFGIDGALQNFFGVPFTCKRGEVERGRQKGSLECQWFAELGDTQANQMIDDGRATKVAETYQDKQGK